MNHSLNGSRSLIGATALTFAFALTNAAAFAQASAGSATAAAGSSRVAIAAATTASTTTKSAPNEAAIAGFGGYAGLMKINLDLVARVKANKLIGSLFVDTDAPRLAEQLSDQFCELLGGGCTYTGQDMRTAHQGMGIKTHHFNALAEELQRAMDAAGVSQREQFRLIAKLAPMKRDVNEAPER